ncbi:MAG: ABC transporter permease, partial [Thermodesulfobacteriota bacterium]
MIISIAGVTFAVLMMVLFRGLYVAYENKVSDYYHAMKVDAWIMQKGTANLLHSYSLLPAEMEAPLSSITGIARVTPYMAREMGFVNQGKQVSLRLVAFHPESSDGPGPLRLEKGTRRIRDGEIIIDQVFARRHKIELKDHLNISGRSLTVSGISSGGDVVIFQHAFITYEEAHRLLSLNGLVNAFLITYDR